MGLIIGTNINKIVTDARILKAFKNRGFIKDYDKIYKYVDSDFKQFLYEFKYKNNTYKIKYFDGCFYPFVIKINK